MTDKLAAVRKLTERVKEEADKLDLKVGDIAFRPAVTEDGRDVLSVVMFVTPEAVETAEETAQRGFDSQFEEIFNSNFGDTTEFADDETKEILRKQEAKQLDAKSALEEMMKDFDVNPEEHDD